MGIGHRCVCELHRVYAVRGYGVGVQVSVRFLPPVISTAERAGEPAGSARLGEPGAESVGLPRR